MTSNIQVVLPMYTLTWSNTLQLITCATFNTDLLEKLVIFFQKEKKLHNDIVEITTFLEELKKQTIFIAFCSRPYIYIYIYICFCCLSTFSLYKNKFSRHTHWTHNHSLVQVRRHCTSAFKGPITFSLHNFPV